MDDPCEFDNYLKVSIDKDASVGEIDANGLRVINVCTFAVVASVGR